MELAARYPCPASIGERFLTRYINYSIIWDLRFARLTIGKAQSKVRRRARNRNAMLSEKQRWRGEIDRKNEANYFTAHDWRAEESEITCSDDEGHREEEALPSSSSTFLSLSEKPDRGMALLDDYEMEELDYDSNPNHRSGLSLLTDLLLYFLLFLPSSI